MPRNVLLQEGDSVIIDVDADGQVTVLNGDKKMVSFCPRSAHATMPSDLHNSMALLQLQALLQSGAETSVLLQRVGSINAC